MFTNEYIMDRKRFLKWAVPKLYTLPIFYIYMVIFIVSIAGWYYFEQIDAPVRWKTMVSFLSFIALYRGVFFKKMAAAKQFQILKQEKYNGKNWKCKIVVENNGIRYYINSTLRKRTPWGDITKLSNTKSYLELQVNGYPDGIRLDKDCFTRGDSEAFISWMQKNHPEIPCVK